MKRWNAGGKPRRRTKEGVRAGDVRELRSRKANWEGHQQAHRFPNTTDRSRAKIEVCTAREDGRAERSICWERLGPKGD